MITKIQVKVRKDIVFNTQGKESRDIGSDIVGTVGELGHTGVLVILRCVGEANLGVELVLGSEIYLAKINVYAKNRGPCEIFLAAEKVSVSEKVSTLLEKTCNLGNGGNNILYTSVGNIAHMTLVMIVNHISAKACSNTQNVIYTVAKVKLAGKHILLCNKMGFNAVSNDIGTGDCIEDCREYSSLALK